MFRISCPSCSKRLKFKDASRVGKRVKCPQCGESFVIALPDTDDEVEMELVQPPAPESPTATPEPLMGTSARYVPDDSTEAGLPPQIESPTARPDFETVVPPAVTPATPATAPDPLVVSPVDAAPSHAAKLRERRKRGRRTGWIFSLMGTVLVGAIGAAMFIYQPEEQVEQKKPVVRNKDWDAEQDNLKAAAIAAQDVSPTSGEPIELKYMPPGASVVVHLRASEIWSDDDSRREFVYGLGPLGKWLETKVRELTRFEPKEIESLTIAIGLGPRESEPEISAAVRLHEPQQRSVFIRQRVQGQRDPAYTEAVYVGDKQAWLIVDEKTFAVGPAHLAADLVASMSYDADPSDDLRMLISKTDRDRHVTILVDRSALEIHTPALFDESVQPVLVQFTDWLGKDVDAIAASLHLGDRMFLETLFRSGTGTTAGKLNRHIRSRVDELPSDVLEMVRLMTPRRKGPRQIIARFPAMMKAVAAASDSGIGDRLVQLTTVLPERAIPNIAVGTILTWDESTRTDFDRERTAKPKDSGPKLPTTLAGRLKQKIEIEFKRTPLEEAFGFLGEDTGINFQLDGDGLELAGYTRVMPQTMNLGEAPVTDGVKGILQQYDQMVLTADEKTMTVTVTTKAGLEASGKAEFVLP